MEPKIPPSRPQTAKTDTVGHKLQAKFAELRDAKALASLVPLKRGCQEHQLAELDPSISTPGASSSIHALVPYCTNGGKSHSTPDTMRASAKI